MKYYLILVLFNIYLNVGFSQTKLPSYHKIEKSDLEMTDCNFDKGAEAIKLIDYANMYFDRGTAGITLFKTIYDYRLRIKILKNSGLSYANVEIPFYSYNNDEKISKIDACTYNLDDAGKVKITDVGKSSIYIKRYNKRISRMVIAFPDVKVGSVIEYRYRLERETYSELIGWKFQDNIPTRYSEYEVRIPRIFVFTPQPTIYDSVEVKEKEIEDVVSIDKDSYTLKILKQNFIMRNLIGIKNEPFMGSAKDYKQRIEFQLSQIDHGTGYYESVRSNWTDVIKSLNKDEDFGLQLKENVPEIAPVISEALTIEDKYKRINFIFNSIRYKMNCTDWEAIFTDEGIKNAWKKKTGNIADINLLLINVLNKSGINAMPVLLSTRDNGMLNMSFYSIDQFNTVMVYIKLDDGFLVLDGSDKFSDFRLTPIRIVNTKGFVVDKNFEKWIDVINNSHKYSVLVALQGTIDDNGIMKGDCSVSCSGYARKQRIESYQKNKAAFEQQYFIKPYPAVTISDITVSNNETDSLPFIQKINFTLPISNSGEYSYFNTNMFNDLETNPFIAENRIGDIDFGFQQEYVIYGNFKIPDGFVYENLPENVSMSMKGKAILYNRVMTKAGNDLNIKITVEFKRPFYLASNYSDFYEFYKKLMKSLNEQIVIKKK